MARSIKSKKERKNRDNLLASVHYTHPNARQDGIINQGYRMLYINDGDPHEYSHFVPVGSKDGKVKTTKVHNPKAANPLKGWRNFIPFYRESVDQFSRQDHDKKLRIKGEMEHGSNEAWKKHKKEEARRLKIEQEQQKERARRKAELEKIFAQQRKEREKLRQLRIRSGTHDPMKEIFGY